MWIPKPLNTQKILFEILIVSLSVVGSNADDQSSHVLIQFDVVQLKDWTDVVLQELKIIVSESIENYCKLNASQCDNSYLGTLESNNVIIEPGYPKEVHRRNSLILLSVVSSFQSNKNETNHLSKSLVKNAIVHYRKEIQNSLLKTAKESYEISYRISYINNVLVLEQSDQTLNKIITPFICVFVLAFSFIIWVIEKVRWKKLMFRASQLRKKVSPQELIVPSKMIVTENVREEEAIVQCAEVNVNTLSITRENSLALEK